MSSLLTISFGERILISEGKALFEEGAARKTSARVRGVLRSISEGRRMSEVAASEDFYISWRASRIVALEGYTAFDYN